MLKRVKFPMVSDITTFCVLEKYYTNLPENYRSLFTIEFIYKLDPSKTTSTRIRQHCIYKINGSIKYTDIKSYFGDSVISTSIKTKY